MVDIGEWVNLLRTPEERPSKSNSSRGRQSVKVLENTPQGKVGVKKRRPSEVQVLRSQVAALVREKGDITLEATRGEELLNSARKELQAALEVNSQAKSEMEDQRRIIHRLSADNARLIRQVETLWQQSPGLKSPSLTNHTHHPSPSSHDHTNGVLVKDLERLSQRATELSQALAAAQQSRTTLEKEVLAMKRSQLELQTSRSQLEEALAKSEEERASLYRDLQEREEGGRRRLEQLQLHMDTAMAEKTTKLEELLSLSERLQSALTSLSSEKGVLEQSLRSEVAKRQQLVEEKQGLECHVTELEAALSNTRQELSHMQDQQLQEVTKMKTILENEMISLQQERDQLSQQVEEGGRERSEMEREVEATRAELTDAEGEIERLTEKVGVLQDTLSQLEKDQASELSHLTVQLAEVSARWEGLQRELRECQEECQAKTREQVEGLTNQLQENAVHVEQMETERVQLQQLLDVASHDLQAKSRDLDSAQSELHASQMTNTRLEQQVADLETKVVALNDQISGRSELTNEMRALLDQRANQIQELETIVAQQREQIISNSHTHLSPSQSLVFSSDSTHILQATPIKSSLSHSLEPHPLTTPPTNEVVHLRKQLSESRDNVVGLQSSCEEMKTQVAKLQGSVQALTTIKERLVEENNSLLESRRQLEEGRRRAEEGRRSLSRQVASLQGMVTSLRSQLAGLQEEREDAMSRVSELQEAFTHREAEIAEELAAMEVQSVAASEHWETGEVERDYLQLELAKSRTRNTELETQALETQDLLDRECSEIQREIDRCTADLCTLRRDDTQVQEDCHLAAAVNARQTNQIAEKERCVSELLGEVEVLRARKAVVLKWLCDQEGPDRNLELEKVHEQLEHCRAAYTAEVSSLTRQLRETEGQLEALRRDVRGTGGDSRDSRGGARKGEGERRRAEKRIDRLQSRLKTQVEQSNYLRVKLGYTLKELQLYKDLKAQLDSQLAQQSHEISSLHEHYTACLKQLQQVERLGFQATVLPSNTNCF